MGQTGLKSRMSTTKPAGEAATLADVVERLQRVELVLSRLEAVVLRNTDAAGTAFVELSRRLAETERDLGTIRKHTAGY